VRAGGAIALGMTMRGLAWIRDGHDFMAAEVYYATFGRFDELLPGVAIAMLKNFHPVQFGRILRHANALLAAGVVAVVAILTCMNLDLPNIFITTAFGFSLLAMSFALLVCAALSPHCPLNRVRIPGAAPLALWSYAVYLVHKPVFMALNGPVKASGIAPGTPLLVLTVMGLGVLGGWLLFRCVETPFVRLRTSLYRSPVPAGSRQAVTTL
jgi:peptidoglycan/LPS O-acetylase OafA/YrhL